MAGAAEAALDSPPAATAEPAGDLFDDPFFTSPEADPFEGSDWDELERWAEDTSSAATRSEEPLPEPAETEGEASQFSSLELVRRGDDGQDRRISVVRRGTDDATGIFVFCQPPEGAPASEPLLAVFSESGPEGVEITIGENVIQVPLAVVEQRQQGGNSADGRIQAGGGAARTLDAVPEGASDRLSLCAVQVTREPAPGSVKVRQGQTQLTGESLEYDEQDGVARIAGPVAFERAGDKPLSGAAGRIEVDVDREKTVLVGNVELRSEGGRVSRAARVEYSDRENLARLIGTPEQPAVSERGAEKLQAQEILYDLGRDEAVAVASGKVRITGNFIDEAPAASTP